MIIANLILAAVTYISPVHFDVLLSGNFGEPRPNHFHGGLDIKTQQEEGKAVYAIGDGYVSRVTVDVGGMGNAVYVRHPDGYTSVYAHLQRFAPFIEAQVRKQQYRSKTTDVDISLEATACPVAQGQLIALSGDTGSSLGPHLHLEIHQNDTWNLMDPLEFIPSLLEDSISPKAQAIMAYPIRGEGVFCSSNEQQRFDFTDFTIADSLTAWGKVGFGLYAEDFMQGSSNRYGVRHTALLVDGKEVFSSDVNNIPVEDHKMVNVWGDYVYFIKNQVWFLRSYILPGNRLPFLKANSDKGVVNFNQEREYELTYVLSDYFGNQSKYSFTVKARPDTIMPVEKDDSIMFKQNEDNDCQTDGVSLVVPKGALLDETKVIPTSRKSRSKISNEFTFANKSVPLYQKAILKLRLDNDVEDTGKLYVSARRKDKRSELDHDKDITYYVEGIFNDGWVEGHVYDLGDVYSLAYDDISPKITPVNPKEWESASLLVFDIKDEQSGISSFEGYIDGQFILFDHVKKSSRIICNLKETPVTPIGKERQLRLLARDRIGNESVCDMTINY